MVKRSLVEELDQAVERIIRNPGAALPKADPRIAPLLRIAAELRDLPAGEFEARLKRELVDSPRGNAHVSPASLGSGPENPDQAQMSDRGKEAADEALAPRDVAAALEGLLGEAKTEAVTPRGGQAGSLSYIGAQVLTKLDQSSVGVSWLEDEGPHWERHPDGEELLHVIEGELDVTTLIDDGAVHTRVPAGSIFVCPSGLWHWPRPTKKTSVLFVTPMNGTESSRAEDPRSGAPHRKAVRKEKRAAQRRSRERSEFAVAGTQMAARDIRGALRGVPSLAISDSTTGEEAGAAFPQLGSLNKCGLFAGRFSGLSPWERHPSADELLHVLEGEVEITTLTDRGPVRNTLRPGSVFVCPKGLWHRQYSRAGVLEFSATPQPTEISFAEDPRV